MNDEVGIHSVVATNYCYVRVHGISQKWHCLTMREDGWQCAWSIRLPLFKCYAKPKFRKGINMSELRKASCHCGSVKLKIIFEQGLQNVRRCDCSLCSRKGYIMVSVPVENLVIKAGQENLSLYQWGTGVAAHYFCSKCGVYTHHQRRSNPLEYGINIACVEGVDALSYKEIPIGNGGLNLPLPPIG